MLRIRKNCEDVYIQRDGTWGPYKTARRFSSQAAAERYARDAGIAVYGLF